ncbi:E3 ubiquitin-protein ligase Os04g0590900-like [Phragmites australis]|uniref:E3 ubiquitin-protein ligase Os04g0590900-like n=1 Tax=Phragmites australis TaxID=29695 RepID=UPI002D788909|nr:E3 ubiquitin-protein ligase Os04g0590900-like [Phragmites australis]
MASSPLAITGTQPTWVPYEPAKDCSQGLCSMYCPQWCYFIFPPPPPFDVGGPGPDDSSGPVFSPLVIAIIGVLAIAFLLVSYYTFFSRYCGTFGSFRGRVFGSNSASDARSGGHRQSRSQESWNVSPSSGLDETLISKITLCKYKRGDAFVHTTDCSVCLGEFRDGESLRLLPKCSHAFHQQCIDKWLKSHSNCPLCRANITFVTVGLATQEPESCGPGESGRDTHEVVVVMDDLEIMCGEQQNVESSTDSDDQEANGGPEGLDEADSKAEIREEGLPPKRGPSSSDPNRDSRMSIADVLQATMEDELMAARESGFLAGGAGSSRRCHGENSREWGRSSWRALQDAMDSVPMKRLPPAGRSCFSNKSGRGKDSDLPM